MRARLIIPISIGILALAVVAQALAAVTLPTQQINPGDAATFTAGDQIAFQASAEVTGTSDHMDFYIARDPTPGPSGVFANFIDHFQSSTSVSGGGTPANNIYSGSPGSDTVWPDRPGTYYWQAVYFDCAGVVPGDCFNESGTRSLTINAKPASAVNSAEDLDTFLDKHPKHRTHKRKVSFFFSSNVSHAKFQCLYANGWAKCKSPHVFHHLKPGRYKFKVRAKANGVKDKTPASFVFRILR
jgi:hypothetical protein